MRKFLLLGLIMVTAIAVSGSISGKVFYSNMMPAKESVIRISTTPQQVYVSVTGSYLLYVNPGNYTMSVKTKYCNYTQNMQISDQPVVSDIILPCHPPNYLAYALLSASAIILLAVLLWAAKNSSKKEKITEDAMKVMEIMRKERRMTQKEIRKNLGWSETKMSLVLAELESEGMVKKIKKGRTNIIILRR